MNVVTGVAACSDATVSGTSSRQLMLQRREVEGDVGEVVVGPGPRDRQAEVGDRALGLASAAARALAGTAASVRVSGLETLVEPGERVERGQQVGERRVALR